jgi:hypothetical protein
MLWRRRRLDADLEEESVRLHLNSGNKQETGAWSGRRTMHDAMPS